MTPEQKKELIAALDADNDVRAITIALQVCAWMARNKRPDDAVKIRSMVDAVQERKSFEAEWRKKRLTIAVSIYIGRTISLEDAIKLADSFINQNETEPLNIWADE